LRQDGFSIVELAIIVPVTIIAVVLAIESVWLFIAQRNIDDAAIEGAGLAAGNFGTPAQIGSAVCNVIDVDHPTSSPRITLTPQGLDGTAGANADIRVESNIRSLTGILSPMFRRITLSETITFELRRPDEGAAQWWNEGAESFYSCSRG
jgi:hypothetical protein